MLTLVVHSKLISDHLQIRMAQGHGWPCTDFCSCGSCHPHTLALSTVKDTETLKRFGSFILFFTPQEPVCKNLFFLYFIIYLQYRIKLGKHFPQKWKQKLTPNKQNSMSFFQCLGQSCPVYLLIGCWIWMNSLEFVSGSHSRPCSVYILSSNLYLEKTKFQILPHQLLNEIAASHWSTSSYRNIVFYCSSNSFEGKWNIWEMLTVRANIIGS